MALEGDNHPNKKGTLFKTVVGKFSSNTENRQTIPRDEIPNAFIAGPKTGRFRSGEATFSEELARQHTFGPHEVQNAFDWLDGFLKSSGINLSKGQRFAMIEGVVKVADVTGTPIQRWLESAMKTMQERKPG